MEFNIPFVAFFDKYADAVFVTDTEGNCQYCNGAFTELTGYRQADILNVPIKTIFPVMVHRSTDTANSSFFESGIARPDGTNLWVRMSRTVLVNDDSQEVKVYTVISNPALEKLKDLLKESETRFATLADATPVMIWMTDQTNLCYYFNKSWLDFTGKTFEEEVGTGWFQNVHRDDWKNFDQINEYLVDYRPYSCEYRLRRHDGVYRYLLEIGTPRFSPDGAYGGYMGSCLDITEMKEAQIELAAQTIELKRSNEELEQFAYVASHDLQEPLRMIGSYVQLIHRRIEAKDTTNLDEYMKFVVDGVVRMQALISDMLQYSRVNRKGNPFAPVDMGEVGKIIQAHLTKRIEETGAKVIIEKMPVISGDSLQLIRLLQNLTENAIKFKAPGRFPEVKISAEERENDYLFSVSDNGIGIDNKFYNRIFVIFQRLHAREEYEGTGIGLAVCKKIVERHGGNIWVESKAGEGSTFLFTIKK